MQWLSEKYGYSKAHTKFMEKYITTEQFQQLEQNFQKLQQLYQQHHHTQFDSLGVAPTDLVNASLYFGVKKVTLTSAQISATHTTPIVLVPASGNNTFNIAESIDAKIVFNSTQYTGSNNLEFRYTNGSGTKVTADMGSAFINSSFTSYDHVAGVVTELTPTTNAPIVVSVPSANPAAGNSTMIFTIKYRIITF